MKDFDSWNINKKEINSRKNFVYYRERDIRWCSLGINVGFEQDGTSNEFRRPVLVIRGFSLNVCLIVPLTSSNKPNSYHVNIGVIDGRMSYAIISQIRLIDTKRLHDRLAVLNNNKFDEIRKAVRDLI